MPGAVDAFDPDGLGVFLGQQHRGVIGGVPGLDFFVDAGKRRQFPVGVQLDVIALFTIVQALAKDAACPNNRLNRLPVIKLITPLPNAIPGALAV